MHQALLIIDVQPSSPQWLIDGILPLIGTLPSAATVERHDESKTPFQKQLGWHPAPDDDSLIQADRIFIKHGYAPSSQTIEYLQSLKKALDRVGIQIMDLLFKSYEGCVSSVERRYLQI